MTTSNKTETRYLDS